MHQDGKGNRNKHNRHQRDSKRCLQPMLNRVHEIVERAYATYPEPADRRLGRKRSRTTDQAEEDAEWTNHENEDNGDGDVAKLPGIGKQHAEESAKRLRQAARVAL